MIKFSWNRVDKENVPILKTSDIDDLTARLLEDFDSRLLKDPAPINYDRFLEFYLGAIVEYMDIYYEDNPIWGIACFNDGELIRVFNREDNCIEDRRLRARTIVLDNYIMQKGREGLSLFTALHEAGHLCEYYALLSPPIRN